MADSVPEVNTQAQVPTAPPPANPQGVLPATQIPIPTGSGVEKLTAIQAPFRTNAPPWFTPPGTVWSAMGCAVAQPGRYIQTNNNVIFETVNELGKALFEIIWPNPERNFDRSPSRDTLWKIHQMIIDARKRMANNAVAPAESPTLPEKYVTAPNMFLAYPVPYYGALGTTNIWLHRTASMTFAAMTEAMQHQDNEYAFHVTKDFFQIVYSPLKYMLVDMAWRFFDIPKATAQEDNFLIPAEAWKTFDDTKTGQTNDMTSMRPPMGYRPTTLDLEPIRGKPYSHIVVYLQHWPDSQLLYASGGIWENTSVPLPGYVGGDGQAGQFASGGNVEVRSALVATSGPPTA